MKMARCFFLTLSVFGRQFVKEHIQSLDVLVIDEAAQASEPEMLIPMFEPLPPILHFFLNK